MSIYNHQKHNKLKAYHFGALFDRLSYDTSYIGEYFHNDTFFIRVYPGVYNDTHDGIQLSLCCKNSILTDYKDTHNTRFVSDVGGVGFYLDVDRLNITYLAGGDLANQLGLPRGQDHSDTTRQAQRLLIKELGISTKEFLFLLASLIALHLGLSQVAMINRNMIPTVYRPVPGAVFSDTQMVERFHLQEDDYGYYRDASRIIAYITALPHDHRDKLIEAMNSLLDITRFEDGGVIFPQELPKHYAGELIGLLRENLKYKQ